MTQTISRVRTYVSREEEDLFVPLIEDALPGLLVEVDYQYFCVRVVIKRVTAETAQKVIDILTRLGLKGYVE